MQGGGSGQKTDKRVAACLVCDYDEHQVLIVLGLFLRMGLVMGDHLLQAIAESAVHATPLLIVWATITPVQMVILRIPLVIEIKATISGVGNEAWWDLL